MRADAYALGSRATRSLERDWLGGAIGALTAGLNLYAALQRVARELHFSYPVLAEEFDYTRRQAELRSMEHALDLTDAVLELRDDPMVLNWVLWQTPGAAPGLAERQARLYEQVKDRLLVQTEDSSNRKRNMAKRLVKKR